MRSESQVRHNQTLAVLGSAVLIIIVGIVAGTWAYLATGDAGGERDYIFLMVLFSILTPMITGILAFLRADAAAMKADTAARNTADLKHVTNGTLTTIQDDVRIVKETATTLAGKVEEVSHRINENGH